MRERYTVFYDGPRTRLLATPTGEWARWNMARVAAIEHLEEIIAEAQATLDVLRRSGNYYEYNLRRAEVAREQESRNGRFVIQEDAADSFKLTGPICRCW